MKQFSSYPKIYIVGHKLVDGIFDGVVEITEKVDGSQFSFANIGGKLVCRSKRTEIDLAQPPKLFAKAVKTATQLHECGFLPLDVVFRAEAMMAPRHNVIRYDRAPFGGMVLFDVMVGLERYLRHDDIMAWGRELNIEVVPLIYSGEIGGLDQLNELLERNSFLGGAKVEGIVIKNYDKFGQDGKPLFAKLVSEQFKERHQNQIRGERPKSKIVDLFTSYRTEARWQKAVQRLDEEGKLQGSPRDIPLLFKEVNRDVVDECSSDVALALFHIYKKEFLKTVTRGLAEWYKAELAKIVFEDE